MITAFYANMVYAQYADHREMRAAINRANNDEVYQGGFLYYHKPIQGYWYRCDGTPYPEDQIDPRLKAWLLLLD